MSLDWREWLSGLNAAAAASRTDLSTRLARARAYIDANLSEPIRLDDVARRACFSRYHFLRLFREQFDLTPHQYLTQRRISRARHLLEHTDAPVTEICLDVGFSSLGSFSSLFGRHVGRSPASYRAAMVQSLGVPVAIPSCFVSMFSNRNFREAA